MVETKRKINETPEVDIFIDSSPESQRAKTLLDQRGVSYTETTFGEDLKAPLSPVPPFLNSRAGQYQGLSGFQDYLIVRSLG
jgi:hypothetical protein